MHNNHLCNLELGSRIYIYVRYISQNFLFHFNHEIIDVLTFKGGSKINCGDHEATTCGDCPIHRSTFPVLNFFDQRSYEVNRHASPEVNSCKGECIWDYRKNQCVDKGE